mmetsp:Transcript_72608/g.151574  ORF Transcript_72608/g.151574 Transcript_72608/m.151574 type:complete len:493 (-) Transcript_72608:163-1641(-)|eukprot:CAMPEP_0206449292 /NCGR_PEP_ID=MMETSP0324_2-20121206/18001_1 /ASSEMBLY_ACC=CAM_ASM_000836 /TAXON_ID=2866 /ORGANISM="Crypthecodinium cohnii, Strain Seligo" /LENGTH=492 /DNA_ID=CAMNT_0053918639 /DNA_START=97 /DNA_END=1575 /DNA_ORIENTATION=-
MVRVLTLGLSGLASATLGSAFEYKTRYACGVCREVLRGQSCEVLGRCESPEVLEAQHGCSNVCGEVDDLSPPKADVQGLELRVSKALGSKDYNLLRISAITSSPDPPTADFFDYSAQFKYKWTQFYLHSALKAVTPGQATQITLGGQDITLSLPAKGAGVTGLLIADPCVNSPTGKSWVGCRFGDEFKTIENTPTLINTFASGDNIDFWSITGDNFYDRTGEITADVFSRISLQAKSKIFNTVPGNHDHWALGSPDVASVHDQCGNGFMQYYGQDSYAAKNLTVGSTEAPFDYSINPHRLLGCKKAAESNFIWYNQIGNLGMIGQNGAFGLDDTRPFLQEACAWAANQEDMDVLVLFGHWDVSGMGAEGDMAMPAFYSEVAAMPGCDKFEAKNMLKFVMGHTHCNDPHPHGKVGAGFRVAGFGMDGCGNYGVPLIDTSDNKVRFWYFDTSDSDRLNEVVACVSREGWKSCTSYATLWLNEDIPAREERSMVV